jgi:hypothetical protein
MMQAAIAAKISSASALPFAAKGLSYVRNYGERFLLRGGGWGGGAGAGMATLDLSDRRSHVSGGIGFRPAFIG